MKQFIVLSAVLPFLLLFMAQFTLDQVNSSRISAACDIVYAAREQAKQDGGFDIESLRAELAQRLGADPSLIEIDAPKRGTVPRINEEGERGIIKYRIKFPVGEITAGRELLGIKDKRQYGYVIDSCAPSEYLPDNP